MTEDAPLLELDGLTFRYRRASEPAIRDVSLRIEPGEIVLVAGPSGCGKSTLIRAINGLIPHAYRGELAGSVQLNGRDTRALKLRDIALVVGTVLQDPAKQIVGATVESELAFGPENLGLDRREIAERIDRVMDRAELGVLRARETAALSGGERQLLAVAGMLMMEPRIYVVDEPLANLDPATASRLLGMLRTLADEGHAVIIVEHRVEEALELRPDRVLAMDTGRVAYLGPMGGFFDVADPSAVKLPFDVVMARTRAGWAGGSPAAQVRARPKGDIGLARLAYDDVHLSLGERPVLRGLNAELGGREVVAVLGPNGSGKTTMLRAAMRLVEPERGTVRVDGRSIRERTVAELARTFGYVFQSPSQMLFARTVHDELLFGPRNLGLEADEEALVADVLRRTSLDGLEGIGERPPLTLSFGQQKRLALAIALALRPPTLILDEPSAGQDHRTAEAFLAAVGAIPGLESVYLVTHDVDLALTHADRILVLRDGQIVANGSPRAVIQDETLWASANLRRTSLIAANLAHGAAGDRFLDTVTLARQIAGTTHIGHPSLPTP
jgi:energy-coupling factor transport system ATP-binding protein